MKKGGAGAKETKSRRREVALGRTKGKERALALIANKDEESKVKDRKVERAKVPKKQPEL